MPWSRGGPLGTAAGMGADEAVAEPAAAGGARNAGDTEGAGRNSLWNLCGRAPDKPPTLLSYPQVKPVALPRAAIIRTPNATNTTVRRPFRALMRAEGSGNTRYTLTGSVIFFTCRLREPDRRIRVYF